MTESVQLSPQNPWPGLRAFTEGDRAYFFGRERETSELFELVQRSPVVVLYGQSGLGKTSVVQAGLLPELKHIDFLPLRVRFDHGDGAPPLAQQIKNELAAELDRTGSAAPSPGQTETLWEYFHRRDVDFWGPRNRLLTPVIILDQFEEVFTLGQRTDDSAARVATFAAELEAVLEHRAPQSVRERLDANPDDARRYDLDRRSVKFVISLREDFLPDLDPWRARMPSLLANRFRLERMTGAQALEVVEHGGRALVDSTAARAIVDFVSQSKREHAARAMEQRDVEPALLSVVCDELNRRRIDRGRSQITVDLLTHEREEIIQNFYDRAFDGVAPGVRDWVEERLLTASGYRNRAAFEDALKAGLPEAAFDQLVDRRILHREERAGVVWLELTHDLLADPASQGRAVRDQRRAADSAKLREAELSAKLRNSRRQVALLVVTVLLIVAGASLGFFVVSGHHAKLAALTATQTALHVAERAGLTIDDPELPAAIVVKTDSVVKRDYAEMLSQQGAASELGHAQFLTSAADALFRIGYVKEGLGNAHDALDLLGKLHESEVPGDELQVQRAEALYSLGVGLRSTGDLAGASRSFAEAIARAAAVRSANDTTAYAVLRVNVLARIGLGQVDEDTSAFALARPHFQEALDLIKPHLDSAASRAPGADAAALREARAWQVLALQELGRSQLATSDAQRYYADAASVDTDLMAHDPDDLRWARSLARIRYLQGLDAEGSSSYEKAETWLTQAVALSVDLRKRDPQNLEWLLGLVQSQQGLGQLHADRGEWDLAQQVFRDADTLAADLTVRQPTWTPALYAAGQVAFRFGDVLRAEYDGAIDQTPQQLAPLLRSADTLFSAARASFARGMQASPRQTMFAQSTALAIGRQGYVLDKEGKQRRALENYSDALANLAALPLPAEGGSDRLRDQLFFKVWAGDAWSELASTADAQAAYTGAIATAKELLKKQPDADAYDLLSWTYGKLADADFNAKAPDDAAANYRLGEEAARRALTLVPSDVQFHVQEARMQGQLARTLLLRNDLVRALDAVTIGIRTSVEGLATDYADLSLNNDVTYFADMLDTLQRRLQAGPTAQADGPAHTLSADEAQSFRNRLDSLRSVIDPRKLLDRNPRSASWSLRPLTAGTWQGLVGPDRDAALKSVLALNKGLGRDQVWNIRKLVLPFYTGVTLYEAEVVTADGSPGIATFLQHGTDISAVDGTSAKLHDLNRVARLALDDATRATAYLRLFVGSMQSAGNRFVLIETPADLHWESTATVAQEDAVRKIIKPLAVEPSSDQGWQAIGTVEWNGRVFRASFHLSRFGEMRIPQDNGGSDTLPVDVEVFDHGVRKLRPIGRVKAEQVAIRDEQALASNPNDSSALYDLPFRYSDDKRWKAAVVAENAYIAFLRRQSMPDSTRIKQLTDAYLSLSWYQLFARDFSGALASADAGKQLDSADVDLDTNRAHALLFLGRLQEAEAIYFGNRGKTMGPGDPRKWEEVILDDFSSFARDGLIDPSVGSPTNTEIERIRKLLSPASR
jgi:tetratricopeptide (TPR) repeat protein